MVFGNGTDGTDKILLQIKYIKNIKKKYIKSKLAFYLFHLFQCLETLVGLAFGPGTDMELMLLPALICGGRFSFYPVA